MYMSPAVEFARGGLTVRLARSHDDIRQCQSLRYRVFYEERGTSAGGAKTDHDRFDDFCDHLMVMKTEAPRELVGTYRLLRQDVAEVRGGFYSAGEFDLTPLLAAHPEKRFLELGRSCVLKAYRTQPVVELLWQGIWNYVRAHGLDVMLGCASLEGADPAVHGEALGFLANCRPPPPEWRVKALEHRRVVMTGTKPVDPKAALRTLPPLIRGYLRLGCYIGEGAVPDPEFNTTDILIVLPVGAIDPRYFAHFGAPAA
jgi:L-ornithine Nalpha-acyltransferase